MCRLSVSSLFCNPLTLLFGKYYFQILNNYVADELIYVKGIYKPQFYSLVDLDQRSTMCQCKLVSSTVVYDHQSINADSQ